MFDVYHFYFTDGTTTRRMDIPAKDFMFACMRMAYLHGGCPADYGKACNREFAIRLK
jgi:hypothetical protein